MTRRVDKEERLEMPVDAISAGTYFLVITNEANSQVCKVVIKPK